MADMNRMRFVNFLQLNSALISRILCSLKICFNLDKLILIKASHYLWLTAIFVYFYRSIRSCSLYRAKQKVCWMNFGCKMRFRFVSLSFGWKISGKMIFSSDEYNGVGEGQRDAIKMNRRSRCENGFKCWHDYHYVNDLSVYVTAINQWWSLDGLSIMVSQMSGFL